MFDDENTEKIIKIPEKVIEVEEEVGVDEFSKKERKRFAEICPDINLDVGLKY